MRPQQRQLKHQLCKDLAKVLLGRVKEFSKNKSYHKTKVQNPQDLGSKPKGPFNDLTYKILNQKNYPFYLFGLMVSLLEAPDHCYLS